MVKEKGICKCWKDIGGVNLISGLLETDFYGKDWKSARSNLSELKERVERLERCSGEKLFFVRRRIRDMEKEMKRYRPVRAAADASMIGSELVFDAAKCHRR